MSSPPRRGPSSLSSAVQPAASHRASAHRPVDRKHPFPSRGHLQIPRAPEPSDLFLRPAHSSLRRSVDRKHSLLERSQISGSLEFFAPFLHRAHLWLRAHSSRRVPSSLRVASRPGSQASPVSPSAVVLQSCALFPGRACPLMVIPVRLAVAPMQLQPAPANSLSVNW